MFRTALISMFLTSTALADTWTVDDDGQADFDSIQAAVDAASPRTFVGEQDPPEDVFVRVPATYNPAVPAPLLIVLHGYSISGQAQENWWHLWPLAESRGFLYATPTGSTDSAGYPYWNANDNCCDYEETNIDHVAYLTELINVIKTNYNVDPNRIHLVGYSNGGCMSYRMACEKGELLASIVSVAGMTWLNPDNCPAEDPVHVLHVHGTADEYVPYEGGHDPWNPNNPIPSAVETVEQWVTNNGCLLEGAESPEPLDVDLYTPGAETYSVEYTVDCEQNGSASLWRVEGSGHFIEFSDESKDLLFQFMVDHPKIDPSCLGDLDGNNEADAGDLLAVIDQWGLTDSPADINSDGIVDVTDLLIVIVNWGPCE